MHRRLSLVLVWRMHLAFLIWQELSFYQQLSEILNQSLMVLSPEAYYHCMIVSFWPILTASWLLRFPLTNTNVIINSWYILSEYLWTLFYLVVKNLQSLSWPGWFTLFSCNDEKLEVWNQTFIIILKAYTGPNPLPPNIPSVRSW